MEAILVRPRDERQLARFREFFEQEGAEVNYGADFWDNVRAHRAMPAVMTEEEMWEDVRQAEEEFEAGKGTRHEDFVREVRSWL